MLLFRPPLQVFGRPGVLPADFASSGDEPSPLDNDLPELADREQSEWLWTLLAPLPASGTTLVNDRGAYALVSPGDGTHTQAYRILVMPLTGAPVVAEGADYVITTDAGESEPPDVVPPTVTDDPDNVSVLAGATATFTVAADSGGGTLSFQWRRNGVDISGATSSSYTTPATTVSGGSANNGDQYDCVVSNSAGSDTSAAAVLTVTAVSGEPVILVVSSAAYFRLLQRYAA